MEQSNNLKLRILSSIVLFALCFVAIISGKYIVCGLVMLIAVLSYREWITLVSGKNKILEYVGLVTVVIPNTSLAYLSFIDSEAFIWLLICITVNDVGAYCIGKIIGGAKLLESVSPNKTWSGFLGGLLSAFVAGSAFTVISGLSMNFILLTIPISILGVFGDIFESFIKRVCAAKDSGSLIPGHGGVLDRIDGYIFSAPVLLYIL